MGVYEYRPGKWRYDFMILRKRYTGASFNNREEAMIARDLHIEKLTNSNEVIKLKEKIKKERESKHLPGEYRYEHRQRSKFRQAVIRGEIALPDKCFGCKETGPVEGHHFDYSKPFEVIWLCKKCHAKKHAHQHRIKHGTGSKYIKRK